MKRLHLYCIPAAFLLTLASAGHAQTGQSARDAQNAKTAQTDNVPATAAANSGKMDWWRKARFGMFIHWGVYSVPAGIYHGKPTPGLGEWIMQDDHIPRAEYATFAKEFNPTAYDPEAWVLLAKAAGMKYIVITAKHHDGFALFGTSASDWNIVQASPYGKDLLEPLVEACRKYHMKIGFYYSQANDWYNPGGAAAFGHWDSTQTTRSMDDYIDHVAVPEVREILTRYGDVAELWWDVPTDMTPERAAKFKPVIALQPNIITNDRLGGDVPGDITTPEQYVPATGIPGRDWETCMTINDTWGFKQNDTNWKSAAVLIGNLVEAASKGGNYLLNVGPDANGRLPLAIVDRLKAVGKWMDKYSESIYGTNASPFSYLPWGRCTSKTDGNETILYFHVFAWPKDGKLLIPGLESPMISASLLGNTQSIQSVQTPEGPVLQLPLQAPDPIVSVVKVVINGTPKIAPYTARQRADGTIHLMPEAVIISGEGDLARVQGGGNGSEIGYWTNAACQLSWKITVTAPASYTLHAALSTPADATSFSVAIGENKIHYTLKATGGYDKFKDSELGNITLPKAGTYTVTITPDADQWKPMNLRSLILKHL